VYQPQPKREYGCGCNIFAMLQAFSLNQPRSSSWYLADIQTISNLAVTDIGVMAAELHYRPILYRGKEVTL
jgi:hypothetical protein